MKFICPKHGLFTGRCAKCAAEKQSAYAQAFERHHEAKRQRTYDETKRDKASQRFYKSAAWRRTRDMVLRNEPLCRMCGKPATLVDHIKPIRDGGAKLDAANLQPLCHACHNTKTHDERKGRGGL